MSEPQKEKRNGLGPWTWSDIILLVALLVGGLVWGMKLEGRYDAIDDRVRALELERQAGILPRADERLKALESRVDDLEGN